MSLFVFFLNENRQCIVHSKKHTQEAPTLYKALARSFGHERRDLNFKDIRNELLVGLQQLSFMPPQGELRILKINYLEIHKNNILKHTTKCKNGDIQERKKKQQVGCPNEKVEKLPLEFTIPGNRAALAKERSRHAGVLIDSYYNWSKASSEETKVQSSHGCS